jgi:hypothetical protein
MPRIPALNEVRTQTGSEPPQYPDEAADKRYLILYPDDYEGHGIDVAGNVALLVNEDNAREIKRLAENIIQSLDEDTDQTGGCPTCGASALNVEKKNGQYHCTVCGSELDGENE